ncbi:MAG: prepilin peptidase [Pseudomonadota bacterium]
MIETCLALFFPFLMIYAASSDLFSMTIPNFVSGALITGFIVAAYLVGFDWNTIMWHWIVFFMVLFAGFTLFSFGVMGGGDAKLAAATALWFGTGHVVEYIYMVSILGAVLTIGIIIFRGQMLPMRVSGIDWVARIHAPKNGIPYGIALGTGALMVYPKTPWMEFVISRAISL